ncbi:hypothetical protein FKM82_018903 [Ascaphus truei]
MKQASVLVALSTTAFQAQGYSSHGGNEEREYRSDSKEKCALKKSRRLPSSMTVDISIIGSSYLESLAEAEGIESRSLAPWDYSLNVDPNRYPRVIAEANCLSSACTDSDGKENPDLTSHPIQQEIMVLRRGQKDCNYIYTLETQLVTLGCTCTRPSVSSAW